MNASDRKKTARQLVIIAGFMLIVMTIYEVLKQLIYPDITIWQSHIVTIIFSTICASVVSFFVLRKQNELNTKLELKSTLSYRLKNELERTIETLETRKSEIKTLTGLLPICSSCKKIRDDKGYWNQIESYIQKRSEADFSHGICPECAKKLYPEYYEEEK
jgi:hypothetical protein